MDSYEKISGIPILEVLNRLNIGYKKAGPLYALFDNGKAADGWVINIPGNYINDFSGKDRARGGPFPFIKDYLGLSNKETFERFHDKFGISFDLTKKQKSKYISKQKLPKYSYNR